MIEALVLRESHHRAPGSPPTANIREAGNEDQGHCGPNLCLTGSNLCKPTVTKGKDSEDKEGNIEGKKVEAQGMLFQGARSTDTECHKAHNEDKIRRCLFDGQGHNGASERRDGLQADKYQ